jgi:hypothetical protein
MLLSMILIREENMREISREYSSSMLQACMHACYWVLTPHALFALRLMVPCNEGSVILIGAENGPFSVV